MSVMHRALRPAARLSIMLAIIAAPLAHADNNRAENNRAENNFYQQKNLVANGTISAPNKDPNLVNGWGVAFNPFGFVWVSANGTGTSTLYDGDGKPQTLVVQIPAPAGATGKGTPTGIVFSGSTEFVVTQGALSGPSRFLFATEDGVIAGWAPTVNPTQAIRVVDVSKTTQAVYKGLAVSAAGNGSQLYAADFRNARVDVFDATFKPVALPAGAFTDKTLPVGYAPFGIQAILGNIYVSYAKQDAAKHDEIAGKGLGFVNVYDPSGQLIRRVASQGSLNAPWGMTLAPAGFGKFSNRLLVGNFGDGLIHAYDPTSGRFVGKLRTPDHQPLRIGGLWGLAFGNGFQKQPVNTLFFAAGPNREANGLYGRIDVTPGDGAADREEHEGADD